ncbi:YhgE/Pip domain-containing protein [Glaciihabitans sp. dw_435]|uniref:YhgE/Pip domain-containing protein n=1 Tax=Glaciihabitans sp. dw_435 TaxID=2720081 RepID=UPI001BD5EB50|nr:YhgE/Pip domain-containing protein [Glaciihabitans sp. dw_435]
MGLFSLPSTELARFGVTTKTKAALVIMAIIPALYGGLYLASNWNPTGHLDRLTAAVVDEDVPATVTATDGSSSTISAGADLTKELLKADSGFTWVKVSAATARAGLDDGKYAATLVVPASFSTTLGSVSGDDPAQAKISVTTNDATSYLTGTITNTVSNTIQKNLASSTTSSYLDKIYVGFTSVHDELAKASDGANQLTDGATTASNGSDDLVTGLGTLSTGATKLASGSATLATGAKSLATGAASLDSGLSKLQSATKSLPAQTQQLADGTASAASGSGTLLTGTKSLAAGAKSAKSGAASLATGASSVSSGAAQVSSGLAGLLANYDSLTDAQRKGLLQQLAGGASQTASGAASVSSGASSLSDGVDKLATGSSSLVTGATSLNSGLGTLASGTAKLAAAAPTLYSGISQSAAGAGKLSDGASSLSTGAASASTGAASLADGAASALAGGQKLSTGLHTLSSGATDLSDGLADGVADVPSYTDSQRASLTAVASDPVTLDRTHDNAVSTYGDGLAPYFIPLALWVGGIVTFTIFRALSPRAVASGARSWRVALAGFAPGALFGAIQALVLMGVLIFGVGLTSPHIVAAVAFAVLVGVSFTAVHDALAALFGGGIGRLIALILLMLQLTSAGGTYPLILSPGFFQAISPYLPMSYAVTGMRHLIAGGDMAVVWSSVAHLVLFMVIALALAAVAAHRNRVWTVGRLHPSLSI